MVYLFSNENLFITISRMIIEKWTTLTSTDSVSGLRDKTIENSWLPGKFSQNVKTIWLPTAFITWTVPVNWEYFVCPTNEPKIEYEEHLIWNLLATFFIDEKCTPLWFPSLIQYPRLLVLNRNVYSEFLSCSVQISRK